MIRAALVVMLLVACSKPAQKTGSPELDQFELDRGGRAFTDAYVSRAGVFIHRKLVVPPAKLATPGALKAALGASKPASAMVVLDIDLLPVVVAQTLLRDLDGTRIEIAHRDGSRSSEYPTGIDDSCVFDLSSQPIANPEATLSIEILADRVHIGTVPGNQFYDIRHKVRDKDPEIDWEKLDKALKHLKGSESFVARDDAELAVDPTYPSVTLVNAALVACHLGFKKLSIVPRLQLTAKVNVPDVVDFSGLATAAEVIAKMRERQGKEGFTARIGKDDVCDWMKVVAPATAPSKPAPGTGTLVALVRTSGGAWVAMSQTLDAQAPSSTEPTHREQEVPADALRAELTSMRLLANIKEAPLQIAAGEGVDGATFLAAIRKACEAHTVDFDLRAPGELSLKPPS
ncbi:MAG: hypothetical protein JWP01_1948 [Myxococcales bacterium]|nr:hypothetical protein [Myxococcales bacterium]